MRRLVPPHCLTILVFALLAAGCAARAPEPIVLNEDQCDYCRMTISDGRFGGEAVLATGRVRKFDSAECLAGWARATAPASRGALFVIDAEHPGAFVPVEGAGFLKGAALRSPMGQGIIAFADSARAERQRASQGGRVMTWRQLMADTVAAGSP